MNNRRIEQAPAPRHRRRIVTILVCAVFLGATWAAVRSPTFVEQIYALRIGFGVARWLSIATGVVPVSLAEFALAGVVLYLAIPAIAAIVQIVRHRRSAVGALAAGLLRTLAATGVVLSLFYFTWAVNYARAPLASRLGWQPLEARVDAAEHSKQTEEIARLATQLVDATNEAYRVATGADDLGRPTTWAAAATGVEGSLEPAYARVQESIGLEPQFAATRGRAKPLLASALLNHLGLTGFYFPWTGEANYNRLAPAPTLPHTIAHEKAHQRGIASEDEASFVGYLACVSSDDPYARYSGYLFAQRQLISELGTRDIARARALLALRLKGVQRDVDFIRAFWQQYAGAPARVSERINDTYLKSQGVTRGVESYAASRNLIVLFARHNGDSVRVK